MVREMKRPHSRELQPQSYWLRVSSQAHVNMIGGGDEEFRSNEQAFKWPRRSLRDSHTISLDAQGVSRQKLLGQLEAENAALRGSVMDSRAPN